MRFCILCGGEIGDAFRCPNPDCGRIPNFYRDIPGPAPAGRRPSGKHRVPPGKTRADSVGPSRPSVSARVTVPLEAAPVAYLGSSEDPRRNHPVYPGSTEVGARAPANIIIDTPAVSSRHARLVVRESNGAWRLFVLDHGSTNGTFVNGKRVRKAELRPGDRVRFADAEFEVRAPAAEEPRRTIEL